MYTTYPIVAVVSGDEIKDKETCGYNQAEELHILIQLRTSEDVNGELDRVKGYRAHMT